MVLLGGDINGEEWIGNLRFEGKDQQQMELKCLVCTCRVTRMYKARKKEVDLRVSTIEK